ncbi:hypothetical protein BU23DRAFT_636152 [Bimuria novae-zelandiae CBS 107.79]|uniref:Uncharacterized protein n=1 Tax=Bimuria novae-zelandiae CBS 107.79 TaxID=1447943 RepID=A0A6A5VF20_9PLEO|nr:hypothetical protein BU23DRAFT_636152 [Bimuria novae-zelandiae CBS 107.79]
MVNRAFNAEHGILSLLYAIQEILGEKDRDLANEFLTALNQRLPSASTVTHLPTAEDLRVRVPAMRQQIETYPRFLTSLDQWSSKYFHEKPPLGASGEPLRHPVDVVELERVWEMYGDDGFYVRCVPFLVGERGADGVQDYRYHNASRKQDIILKTRIGDLVEEYKLLEAVQAGSKDVDKLRDAQHKTGTNVVKDWRGNIIQFTITFDVQAAIAIEKQALRNNFVRRPDWSFWLGQC